MASSSNQSTELCDDIFALSPKIRFVGIINRMGKLVAGGMRQGVNTLENEADSSKLFLGFALRSEMKKDFDAEFGKTVYSFSERDRIKLASISLKRSYLANFYGERRATPHTNRKYFKNDKRSSYTKLSLHKNIIYRTRRYRQAFSIKSWRTMPLLIQDARFLASIFKSCIKTFHSVINEPLHLNSWVAKKM